MRRDSQDAGDWNVTKEYTADDIVCHELDLCFKE